MRLRPVYRRSANALAISYRPTMKSSTLVVNGKTDYDVPTGAAQLRGSARAVPVEQTTQHESEPLKPTTPTTVATEPTNAEVAAVVAFNFFSSTGIVSANKVVFNSGFTFATTLTFIHFVCTFIGLVIMARVGLYKPKRLNIRKAAKLAAAGMGFVVFSNLSLQHNSVGFYQVMKHMTVVGVVIIEAVLFRKYLPRSFIGSITCICIGVTITGATDFKLNLLGTIYALLNILCTSFYQIWCGNLQKSLEANPLQLQLYIAPLSALLIIPVVPMFDNWSPFKEDSILNFPMTQSTVVSILITGVLALCVNISIFLLIGKTSPVTYNVAGNGKTAFLLALDFLVFGRPFQLANVIGLTTTLAGVIWYTRLKLKEREERKAGTQDMQLKEVKRGDDGVKS